MPKRFWHQPRIFLKSCLPDTLRKSLSKSSFFRSRFPSSSRRNLNPSPRIHSSNTGNGQAKMISSRSLLKPIPGRLVKLNPTSRASGRNGLKSMAAKKRSRLLQKRKKQHLSHLLNQKPSRHHLPRKVLNLITPIRNGMKNQRLENSISQARQMSAEHMKKNSGPMRMVINGCSNRPKTPETTLSLMVRKPHTKSDV